MIVRCKESLGIWSLPHIDVIAIFISSLLFPCVLHLLNFEKSIPMNSGCLTFSGVAFTLGEMKMGWERLGNIALDSLVLFAFFLCQVEEKTLGLFKGYLYFKVANDCHTYHTYEGPQYYD